jgi:hypothetical protein
MRLLTEIRIEYHPCVQDTLFHIFRILQKCLQIFFSFSC